MSSLQRLLGTALIVLFQSSIAFAAGGACPSGLPVSGNNCYFVAANGSDTNSGTSESAPWLHAPGMPACSGNCASLSAGNGGIGIILRGGDTWHEGNPSASPYTGGTWDLYTWYTNAYGGNVSGCGWELANSTCLYAGVDPTWFSGSSWTRPILTGDNPTVSGYGNFASSCSYQVATPSGNFGHNIIANIPAWTVFDSFEMTGLCVSDATIGGDGYLFGFAYGGSAQAQTILVNDYIHGWSATSAAGTATGAAPVTLISGGGGVLQDFDKIVIDGSDSDPEVSAWGTFPEFYHMRDSLIQYTGQGVGSRCHDIHDNIIQHMYYTELSGHYNALECNTDYSASGTANVFYNNIIRHFDPSFGTGEVLWFCPNTTPEYWFNDLEYDVVGQPWAIAGPTIYAGCPLTGGQFWFNSTFVDTDTLPCHGSGSDNSGGAYRSIYNLQMIGTSFDGSGCTGYGDPSNIIVSDATATSQGYTTGSPGTVASNTCANDGTTPCGPTSSSSPTVGAGHNLTNSSSLASALSTAWCTTLATYTGEPAISADAYNACMYGTTDACAYNSTTHAMTCPAQTPVPRAGTGAWDVGAYQMSGVPRVTTLQGTVQQKQ